MPAARVDYRLLRDRSALAGSKDLGLNVSYFTCCKRMTKTFARCHDLLADASRERGKRLFVPRRRTLAQAKRRRNNFRVAGLIPSTKVDHRIANLRKMPIKRKQSKEHDWNPADTHIGRACPRGPHRVPTASPGALRRPLEYDPKPASLALRRAGRYSWDAGRPHRNALAA
jgi:hypothetical protein